MKSLIVGTAVGVLAGMAAIPAASSPPVPADGVAPAVVDSATLQSPPFLSFRTGEERRYVLGPPEELYAGETGVWTMRLTATLGDPLEGIFELTHSWRLGVGRRDVPIGTVVQIESDGELRVNSHGFPLELRFKTNRVLAGWGEEIYTVRYRFEDGRFLKHIAIDGNDLEHVVAVLSAADRDLSVPIGIYALVQTGVDCSRSLPINPRSIATGVPPRRTAGSTASAPTAQPPLRFADNSMCREQLFGNPGLISLMLPALWEQGTGEHEFVLLTPAGPFGMPGFSGGTRLSTGAGGMSIAGGSRFDHQTSINARTNSDVEELRYVERVRVEIGQRTEDAWLFDGMRALDAVYVDDDGVVLRVDLDVAGWYGMSLNGTTAGFDPTDLDARELWVRLLYPSEY